MPLHCPLCRRVNPDEALFCCHDGAALGEEARPGRPVAVGLQPFPLPFVFPSGRFCRNFNELVLACEVQWDEARDLLREGLLEGFLSGLGRSDLSWLARRCAAAADPDLGLDELLGRLPGDVRKPARLAVKPAEVNLGAVARGVEHRFVVHLLNEGMGLVRGSVVCSGPDWLALGEEGSAPDKVFQFRDDQAVTVRLVGDRMRAGFRPQEARLVVESNAGAAVVVVRVEAPKVAPFPRGVLAGADSPRRLAELARAAPREAAAFFENGAVAAWYAANGWTYPVQGPPASGVAALQQFFEALGLAAAPRVELDRPFLRLEGPPGEALEASVVVQTSERRPVFAHATTAEPWLKIDRAVLAGRTARIPVRVPAVPDRPGEVLCGRMQVTANGNQRFAVAVTLTVRAGAAPSREGRPSVRSGVRQAAPSYPEYLDAPERRPGPVAWLFAALFLLMALATSGVVAAIILLTPGDEAATKPPTAQSPAGAPKTDGPTGPKEEKPAPQNSSSPRPPDPPPEPPDPDAAELARRLQAADADERLSALKKLAALGPKAAPALGAVLRAMHDGDAGFRREALAALPKIGSPTAADVDALAALARNAAFPEGRAYALSALAALGPDAAPAAPAVCAALADRNPATRRKAAELLGGLGPAARDAARHDLIEALHDADADVGAAAAAALARLGPPTIADGPTLELLLRDKADAARRYALNAFRDLGPDAAAYAPYLEEAAASDATPEMRRLAVAALAAAAPDARRTTDALTRAVSDADPEVRRAAVAALAQIGPGRGALHGLVRALGSDDTTAKAAEEALKAARLEGKQVGALGDELAEADSAARLRVLALLQPLGANAAPAVPGICAMLKDDKGKPRKQALALLEAIGPPARRAGSTLDDLLEDENPDVRLGAATALASIKGSDASEAVPVLVEGLQVTDLGDAGQAAERDRAVEALARIGEPAVKRLVDALGKDFAGGGPETVRGKINAEARLAAVKALAAIGPPADSGATLSVLARLQRNDPSDAVRDAAKEAAAAIRNK